jgi:hypothetical protein
MTIPRCSSVVWKDVIVVSCPPCCVPVDVKTLPTDAADLADHRARHPQAAGLVEKIPHLGGHVAEAGRRAEDDGVVFGQLLRLGERCVLCQLHSGLSRGLLGHQLRHPLDRHLGSRDAACAFGHVIVTSVPAMPRAPSATASAMVST